MMLEFHKLKNNPRRFDMQIGIKNCIGCVIVALILGIGLGLQLALVIDGFLKEGIIQ